MIIFFVIWYYLWKRGKSFFISLDFKEFVVVVEERGDNFVRIKGFLKFGFVKGFFFFFVDSIGL